MPEIKIPNFDFGATKDSLSNQEPLTGAGSTLATPSLGSPAFNLSSLEQTGKDLDVEASSFVSEEEELPTFNIQPKEEVSMFDRIANEVIPEAKAVEYDEEKIKRFIQHGKDAGKTREEIRSAYESAMNDGVFDVTEQVSEKIIQPEQNMEEDLQGLDIGVKAGQAISGAGKRFKFESDPDDGFVESGLKFVGNLPGNTVQIAGDLIGVVSNPVGTIQSMQQLSDAIVQDGLNKVFLEEGEEVFTNEETKKLSGAIKTELDRIANEPGRIKEIFVENPADVLLSVTGGLGVAKNTAKAKGLTGLANKIEKIEKFTNPINIQAETIKGAGEAISKTKKSIFPEKSLDEIVLEVSQGTEKNIPSVKESLSKIDTSGINTYKDLNNSISEKISEIAKKQDELLPKDEVLKIDDLTTTKGKRTTNFIENALNDLENVGDSTNDLELLNKVDELRDKDFVSVKDINDMARFYGSQFKNKSFDKLGNQKANISASRFENTRKGLKEISRDLLPDDTVKLLDEELSRLFETQGLTEKMAENVTKLSRKITQRGVFEELARGLGKALDLASLGTARGFLTSFLPSNVGNKILNSLALEENLAKNLKRIQELEKKANNLSNKSLVKEANNIFKDLVGDNALKVEGVSQLEDNK